MLLNSSSGLVGAVPKSAPKRTAKATDFGNLDRSTVQAALSAGVPAEHLTELARILKEKPKRLDGRFEQASSRTSWTRASERIRRRGQRSRRRGYRRFWVARQQRMERRAILELTKIASQLSSSKEKKDSLEHLLDNAQASGSSDTGGVGPRKNAAALRALQRALVEKPTWIYQNIEAQATTLPVQ